MLAVPPGDIIWFGTETSSGPSDRSKHYKYKLPVKQCLGNGWDESTHKRTDPTVPRLAVSTFEISTRLHYTQTIRVGSYKLINPVWWNTPQNYLQSLDPIVCCTLARGIMFNGVEMTKNTLSGTTIALNQWFGSEPLTFPRTFNFFLAPRPPGKSWRGTQVKLPPP